MKLGNKVFDLNNKCYIMGILNVTPDSFSDGGLWNSQSTALKHVEQMIEEGADIIDVGGESTRPGYTLISDQEEIERVSPIIEIIKKNFDIPVSIDTYKGNVAEAAVKSGADMINDIWGFKYDDIIAKVAAKYGVACCLMHNRKEANYDSFIQDVINDLKESVNLALNAGVDSDKIVLDPGVGFAKDLQQNLSITNHVEEILNLGYPVLLGTSRKSMIGKTLDLPVDERLEGTLATTAIGVMKGCSIIRVHDIKPNRRVVDMTIAIRNSK